MKRINGRYELQETIGAGGMGMVYKAYDSVVKRSVALKTIRDAPSAMALELFRKECTILAAISHPNIVEIFDIGEFEEAGVKKPYFVMPFLPGDTLDKCSLPVEHVCDVIVQACRGLQAAHDRGLIHRDLKPTNLFILPDHSVKIIDFGVAHMTDSRTSMTIKGGTLPYMSPEQLDRDVAATSDLFSLGVVFYEAVTRRHPFRFPTEEQTAKAIRFFTPPPAWDVNREVGQTISRIIHKCMAKQPYNRFASARDLAETLQKAQRGEPIPMFDPSLIQPRVARATKAFDEGNFEFAAEVVGKLEAEGHADPTISSLRKQLDEAIQQKRIAHLMDSARNCFEAEEYGLAQQKLDQVLRIDPSHRAAMMLQASIQNRLSEQKVDDWIRLAKQHLENNAFGRAREALDNVLHDRPKESTAMQLLAEVDRQEQRFQKARDEKSRLLQAAMGAWKNCEMSAALTKMERLIALEREIPDTSDPERAVEHQRFYNQVRSEHDAVQNALKEARRLLAQSNFAGSLAICDEYLGRYPGHDPFQALKIDIQDRQRQDLSARIAETDRSLEAEPDLDRRIAILKEATKQYPDETHFERALRLTREKRDLVSAIVGKARAYEDAGQYSEALERWETLRAIHQQYSGLDFEIDRLKKRREQQDRADAKSRWVNQVDALLEAGTYERALSVLASAASEFPQDEELGSLAELARQGIERRAKASELLVEGRSLCDAGDVSRGLGCLRSAHELDEREPTIRVAYRDALLKEAAAQVDANSDLAEDLSKRALQLDPAHPLARSLNMQALDRKRDAFINKAVAEARRMQADGDPAGAAGRTEQALAAYPQDPRLIQLRTTLRKSMPDSMAQAATAPMQADRRPVGWTELEERLASPMPADAPGRASPTADLNELEQLFATSATMADAASLNALKGRAERFASMYPDDARFQTFHTKVCGAVTQLFEGTLPVDRSPAVPAQPAKPVTAPTAERVERVPLLQRLLRPVRAGATELASRLSAVGAGGRSAFAHASPRTRKYVLIGGGGVLTAVLAIAGANQIVRVLPVTVEIRTPAKSAKLSVDGRETALADSQLHLRPGVHHVTAVADGYAESGDVTIEVARNGPRVFNIPMTKLAEAAPVAPVHVVRPAALSINSDLQTGTVSIDKQQPMDLQNGQFSLAELPPGPHLVDIQAALSKGKVAIETDQDGFSTIRSIDGSNLAIVGISTRKGAVNLLANSEPTPASIDERAVAGKLGSAPLTVKDVAEGNHELRFGTGQRVRTVAFTVGEYPVLTISASSDRDVGILLVQVGEPDATVTVTSRSGRSQARKTDEAGEVRIANLPTGEWRVRVEKDGFVPDERPVSIAKGKDFLWNPPLTPKPMVLSISGAPEGAQLYIDTTSVGVVPASGTYSYDKITRGPHSLRMTHPDYEIAPDSHDFRPGETFQWRFNARQTRFPISLAITPLTAKVTLPDATELHTGTKLATKQYAVTISAPGCKSEPAQLDVGPGKSNSLTRTLNCSTAQPPPPLPVRASWTAAFRKDGEWLVAPPGGPTFVTQAPNNFQFDVQLQGNSKARWVVAYVDSGNFVQYELSRDKLKRTVRVNSKNKKEKGDKREPESIPDALRPKQENGSEVYRLRLTVSQRDVEIQVFASGSWKALDRWTSTGPDLTAGKFGFGPDTRIRPFHGM